MIYQHGVREISNVEDVTLIHIDIVGNGLHHMPKEWLVIHVLHNVFGSLLRNLLSCAVRRTATQQVKTWSDDQRLGGRLRFDISREYIKRAVCGIAACVSSRLCGYHNRLL